MAAKSAGISLLPRSWSSVTLDRNLISSPMFPRTTTCMPRRRQRACAARRLPPVCLGCFLIMHRASSRFCKFLTSGCQCIQCHSGNLTIDVSMTSCQKCAKPRALFMQHNFANEVARIRKEFSRRTVNDYAQMRQRRVSTGNQCTMSHCALIDCRWKKKPRLSSFTGVIQISPERSPKKIITYVHMCDIFLNQELYSVSSRNKR